MRQDDALARSLEGGDNLLSTEPTIEQRLAALEAAIKEIQDRLGPRPSAEKWWEKIPPVEDIEAFEEAMEYGRAYRYVDRPPDEPGKPS